MSARSRAVKAIISTSAGLFGACVGTAVVLQGVDGPCSGPTECKSGLVCSKGRCADPDSGPEDASIADTSTSALDAGGDATLEDSGAVDAGTWCRGGEYPCVFVTSATMHGDFAGGTASGGPPNSADSGTASGGPPNSADVADRLCANAATAAGLSGTFRAWISGAADPPLSNVAGHTFGLWNGEDGGAFAPRTFSAQLNVDGYLDHTEHGSALPSENLWVGSAAGTCQGWTRVDAGAVIVGLTRWGWSGSVSPAWRDAQQKSCAETGHLLCFQTGK
jgi:hypothetical protein